METTTNRLTLVALVTAMLAAQSSVDASWWGDSKTSPSPGPRPTEHPFVQCPERTCTWVPNATFSCPQAGCMEISVALGDDVEDIYLQNNHISIIPKLSYPKLKLLDLADNNISKIVDYAFETCCVEMTTLLLPYNKLRTLEATTFFGLDSLKYLYLQHNQFKTVPSGIDLTKLERLDFSFNLISEIDTDAFFYMKDLKYLHLQENRITDISKDVLWNLRSLEWLELMENNIQILKENTFYDLKNLLHLDLNFNNISVIETDAFLGLDNLKRLSIEHNMLTSIHQGMFKGLTHLDELFIGYNYIQEIEEGIFPPSLNRLSLIFSHQLQTLRNGSLTGMANLNEVYINSCHNLQEIEGGVFGDDTSIEVLDLSNNHLQTLPEDLVSWNQLVYLDLSGNPWDCDCHLEWMLEINMPATARSQIRCDTPLGVRGKFLTQLKYDEFRCGDGYNVTFRAALATALVLFFTFLCIMTIILFLYKCRDKVCPCWYTATVGKYRAMYNTVDDADDESTVQFEKKPPSNGVHGGTTV